jgi:hypothetical protein
MIEQITRENRSVPAPGLAFTVNEPPDPWLSTSFQPDFLVPVQYYELVKRPSVPDGETRLMFAVLEDAVRCYIRNLGATRTSDRELFFEAARWFEASTLPHHPFSFEHICDVLEIDSSTLRKQLRSLKLADLPTKQMRSVGRRHLVRPKRASKRARAS